MSDRERTAEALRRSEAHLAAAQRITHCGSWELDLGDLGDIDRNPLRWSDEVFRIFGYEPGEIEISNEAFFAAVHPDDRDKIHEAVRIALETGTRYAIDHRVIRPDGTIRIVHEESEIQYDAAGRPTLMIGTVQDITEQRLAEEALAGSRAEWQAVVEHAPDVILHLDADGTIRFINRTTIGVPRERVIGMNWLSSLDGENRARLERALASVVATGTPTTVEASALPRGGVTPWFSCHLGPIRRDDQIVGVILIARDITQRKEAEHQLLIADRMASVGTLAAGVAHEINNPLAAVIANLEVALRSIAAGRERDVAEQLQDAAAAADRVREIVRDLKMFSRAEEERRVQVDVEQVVESTLRMAGNEIRHRARLVRDFAKVPPVLANEARLGQVVLNLVVNAVQAIPEGDASRHEIRASTRTDPAGRAVIGIADTGAGIPEEIRDRLFTPFFTTKPVGIGTGLGLPICHRIVSALGGEIQFTSEVGRGTEFRVILPPVPAQPPAPAAPEPTVAAPPRRGRILVIDDEPLITRTIKRLLAEHDVIEVAGGAPAIARILAGERFDVILCDLMMPQMSGMDVHAELERAAPDQVGRLVFMTGGAFTPRAAAFLESTSNPRLDKPFDAAVLRRLVESLMS